MVNLLYFLRILTRLFNSISCASNQVVLVTHHPSLKEVLDAPKFPLLELPLDILLYVADFLPAKDLVNFMVTRKQDIFLDLHRLHVLLIAQLREFQRLVAMEGEDNQSKAESMLREYPQHANGLIAARTPGFRDAAGRKFITPISAYGYAFWAGDTRMCLMLQLFMDDRTSSIAFDECLNILDKGVDFNFNGTKVSASKQFDYFPLMNAYLDYINNVEQFIMQREWSVVRKLWLRIGREQSKLPLHVIQEYCSKDLTFFPYSDFVNHIINIDYETCRTVRYVVRDTEKKESFMVNNQVNYDLGRRYTLWKGGFDECQGMIPGVWMSENSRRRGPRDDFFAIQALYQMRVYDDLPYRLYPLKR